MSRLTQLPIVKAAVIAFAAMTAQDILNTTMVIFESHFDAPLAGVMDQLGWIAGLACSAIALDSILTNGWRNKRSLILIAAVSAANFAGTFSGVAIGHALTGGNG